MVGNVRSTASEGITSYEALGGNGKWAQDMDNARGLCARVPQAEDAGLEALRDTGY